MRKYGPGVDPWWTSTSSGEDYVQPTLISDTYLHAAPLFARVLQILFHGILLYAYRCHLTPYEGPCFFLYFSIILLFCIQSLYMLYTLFEPPLSAPLVASFFLPVPLTNNSLKQVCFTLTYHLALQTWFLYSLTFPIDIPSVPLQLIY